MDQLFCLKIYTRPWYNSSKNMIIFRNIFCTNSILVLLLLLLLFLLSLLFLLLSLLLFLLLLFEIFNMTYQFCRGFKIFFIGLVELK